MPPLKNCLLPIIVFVTCAFSATGTWSIIVVDEKTGEIGIAGASCTFQVYGIGAIVPGKGAIVVQAMSSSRARLKGVNMITAGTEPQQIIAALRNNYYYPEEQQYAVVCTQYLDEPAGYTGTRTTGYRGILTARGISVQGNTLTNEQTLEAILKAAVEAQRKGLPVQEILLAALEEGAKYGGDKRCGERKASSAFLTVAKATDDGKKPYLNIIINDDRKGTNAVEQLRNKFESWKQRK